MTPFHTALFQVGVSLLVATMTAWLTVWLSLRRFYREQWWEAKLHAYIEIIQHLHHMKWDLSLSIRTAMHDGGIIDYQKEWEAKHKAAWDEVRKQIDVGEFLYSPASLEILGRLQNEDEPDVNESYLEYLRSLEMAIEQCLPALKQAAKSDLNLAGVRTSAAKCRPA